MKHFGIVKGDKITCGREIRADIQNLDGKQVCVVISEFLGNPVSTQQIRFYRGVILPKVQAYLAEDGVQTIGDAVHYHCMVEVCDWFDTLINEDGTFEKAPRSHQFSNTKHWEIMMDIIRAYYAEKGLEIPFPNEK